MGLGHLRASCPYAAPTVLSGFHRAVDIDVEGGSPSLTGHVTPLVIIGEARGVGLNPGGAVVVGIAVVDILDFKPELMSRAAV